MTLPSSRARSIIIFTLILLFRQSLSVAAVTDWTIDHTPIHYGDSVIYAIVSDGNDQIANMK